MKLTSHQALEGNGGGQLHRMMEEAQVKNYLANNPDFLIKNPQLLTHIELSHGFDQTTSLVERQVKVLRERNRELQGQLIEMLQAAHNNEYLLRQCNHFMLSLLKAKDFNELTHKMIELLKVDFDIDGVSLILIGEYPEVTDPHASAIQRFNNEQSIKDLLGCQFPDSQPLCGRLEAAAKNTLFPEQSETLESFALIPLGPSCRDGMLIIGSQDVNRFNPDMGTLFIELIAKLVAHLTGQFSRS